MSKSTVSSSGIKIVAQNRKARYDYEVLDTYEAGLVLSGAEVKSLRTAKLTLVDSYARMEGDELFLHSVHISPYLAATHFSDDPDRPRKLLLHRKEISKLADQTQQKGLTLVPLRVYFNVRGFAKVEIAVVRGKREYDKRQVIAKRDADRTIQRAVKEAGQ
jgi:SsrA-binding protein